MAWYALWKWFIPWRKIRYTNWQRFYKNYLYDEWFNSLSDEDKDKENRRILYDKMKRTRDIEISLLRLKAMTDTLNITTTGRMGDCMKAYNIANNLSIHPSKYW